MIENKWKRFAISQTLSDWDGKVDAAILFDWIVQTDDKDLVKVFDDYEVIVWQPFEDWTLSDIAEHIFGLAQSAQEVANHADE